MKRTSSNSRPTRVLRIGAAQSLLPGFGLALGPSLETSLDLGDGRRRYRILAMGGRRDDPDRVEVRLQSVDDLSASSR
jgi:hypothetical protein